MQSFSNNIVRIERKEQDKRDCQGSLFHLISLGPEEGGFKVLKR